VRIVLFMIVGVLAAVSGVLLAASLGAGNPSVSQGLEFDIIAAVIVGGTSLYGGRGSMVGTALGVLLIGMLQNGLVLLGVNQYAQGVARGAVIIVAVLIGSARLRESSRRLVGQALRGMRSTRGSTETKTEPVASEGAAVTSIGTQEPDA